MDNILWTLSLFQELTNYQMFDVLQLRVDVFVVEQRYAYREMDECDRLPDDLL